MKAKVFHLRGGGGEIYYIVIYFYDNRECICFFLILEVR